MAIHYKLFPLDMSRLASAPQFSTLITRGKSGVESRNANWSQPIRMYDANFTVRSLADLRTLQDFQLSTRGSLIAFLIQDWTDFAVSDWTTFTEAVTGSSQTFQLYKRYTDANSNTFDRDIKFVETGSVTLQDDGSPVDSADFTVNTSTGVVTYTASSGSAVVTFKVTKFYVPVRFVEDSIPNELFFYLTDDTGLSQIPSIPLREVRYETVSSLAAQAFTYGGQTLTYGGEDITTSVLLG